uniref:Uncharacterized protein n=1 Tax=Aegilops tauschii subsp. strangulata TaxID=200361 RepID=A0A453APG5_AEGTS
MCVTIDASGLRRVHTAERHGHLHRRAGGRSERRLHSRHERHRQHQGAGRGRVHADCLLRRHPRRRGPRLSRPGRAFVDRSSGEEGLDDGELVAGQQRPAAAVLRRGQPHCQLCRQGAQRDGHGRPLWRAHHRAGAVPELPGQALQRDQHRYGLRNISQGQLPTADRVRRQQPGTAGHDDAQRVRQRILPQPDVTEGAPALRPGSDQRRTHRGTCPDILVGVGAVQQGLQGGHGEHGEHQPAHRDAGAGQAQLLQGEL